MPNFESEYAKEGTRAHELAAEWLEKGKLPPDNYPEDDRAAIEQYVMYLKNRWRSFAEHPDNKWLVEHRFSLEEIFPGLFGTADSVMYEGATSTLYVDDLKFGKGIPVDAEGNPQLMYYGVGALMSMKVPVKKVVLTIHQPRYSTDVKDAVKSAEVDPLDLMDFIADLKDYAEATTREDLEPITGDHCQFCRAKPICPALKAETDLASQEAFSPENLRSLEPAQIANLLDKIDAIEAWCKGVTELAYEIAKTRKIPGYKLVAKQARRKWNNPLEAQKALEMVLSDSAIRECLTDPELKTPAQVEKVLGKANADLVANLCSAVSSGEVLVPEYDKRPEINSQTRAQAMFDAIESKE